MSGENRTTLVHTDILFPNGLVIDHSASPKRLFWTDAGGDYIQSINLDGHDRQKILKKSAVNPRRPFGITILHDNLYFSDWKTGNIYAIKKSNGVLEAIQNTTESGTEEKTIMGLVMSDKSRQPEGLSACGTNNGGCSNLCLPNLNGVKCFCPDGVHLNADGKTCSRLKDFLIFADAIFQTIYTIPISTTTQIAQPVIFPSKHNSKTPIAVEYDVTDERLYWTDISLKTISRAYLNGSGFQVLHKKNIEQPEGIAIDTISRTIYWTDSNRSVIEVSGVDGTSRRTLIHTSTQVRDVQVDFRNGNILWTEWCKDSIKAKIGRANMDGSFQSVLISKGVCFPNGLTLDHDNNILYWMDAKLNHIESYNFTNGERKILNNHYIGWDRLSIYMEHPFGLTTNGDLIFWTDWATNSVYGAKQNSGTNGKRLVAALGKPMDIVASSGLSPDALLPEIVCPSDYSLYNKNKYSLMTRLVKQATLKKASPQKSNIVCSPNEVLLKSYGVYTVSCTANSYGKKSSSCSYRLWVKDHFCQRLTPPMNGKILCKTHCTVTCDERFVLAKSMTKEMVCSGQRWRPLMNKQVNLLPACLEEGLPKAIEIISSFAFKEACNKLDQQELTSKFRIKLEEVVLKIKEAKEVSTDVTIKEIKLTCSDKDIWLSEGRFKTLKVVFTLILNSSDNQIISDTRILNPKRKADATKSILLQNVNNGQFTLVLHGKSIEAKPNSYSGTELAVCNLGEVKKSFYCIRCLLGMYANETTGDCEPCPVGYYQNKEGQTRCLKCPANTSTVVMGTETHLGCYGNGILVDIETESNIGGVKIFQDVMASIINEYCEGNVCPTDEDEIIDSDGVQKRIRIDPSDVVVPLQYPITLKGGKNFIRIFVVISFANNQLKAFPREKLESILYRKKGELEKRLGSEVNRKKNHSANVVAEISSNDNLAVSVGVPIIVVFVVVIAVIIAVVLIYRKQNTPAANPAGGPPPGRTAEPSPSNNNRSLPDLPTSETEASGSLDIPPPIPRRIRTEVSGSHEGRGIYVTSNITNREDTAARTALRLIDVQDETSIPMATRTEALSGSLEDRPPTIPPRIRTEASRSLEVRSPSIPTTTRAEARGSHEGRGIYVTSNITNREDTAARTALRLIDLQDENGYTRLQRHTASAED